MLYIVNLEIFVSKYDHICDLCKKEMTQVNSVMYYLHIICSFCVDHI
jgi:hypothetical protein